MKHIIKILNNIIQESTNKHLIVEQDNNSPFTEAEQAFLGFFDKFQSPNLGIIYSTSDAGIREFISRSGAQLNITPEILASLIDKGVIKVVPYGGFGRNTDYTLELQFNINNIKGMASKAVSADEAENSSDSDTSTSSSSSGGGFSGGGFSGGGLDLGDTETDTGIEGDVGADGETETPTEEPAAEEPATEEPVDLETAGFMKYGDILSESAHIVKQLLTEKKKKKPDVEVHLNKSRILQRLPQSYIYQLKRIIEMMTKKTNNVTDKERLVADVLDTLQLNFELEPKHITKAYQFHRNQKRLQNYLNKK